MHCAVSITPRNFQTFPLGSNPIVYLSRRISWEELCFPPPTFHKLFSSCNCGRYFLQLLDMNKPPPSVQVVLKIILDCCIYQRPTFMRAKSVGSGGVSTKITTIEKLVESWRGKTQFLPIPPPLKI